MFVGREKVNCPAGAREAGLGHDLGAPFCRVSPCGASSFSAWKRNQKTLGGGRNRRFGKASRLHAALPLEPPLRRTRTCRALQYFRRAKSEWVSKFPPSHWALGEKKFPTPPFHFRT